MRTAAATKRHHPRNSTTSQERAEKVYQRLEQLILGLPFEELLELHQDRALYVSIDDVLTGNIGRSSLEIARSPTASGSAWVWECEQRVQLLFDCAGLSEHFWFGPDDAPEEGCSDGREEFTHAWALELIRSDLSEVRNAVFKIFDDAENRSEEA